MKIFIIDSGIGGISLLNALKSEFPNQSYLYFADDYNHPYGKKSKKEVVEICQNAIEYLAPKKEDILIFACNTASTCFEEYAENYPFKILFTKPKEKYFEREKGKTLFLGTRLTCQNLDGKLGKNVILKSLDNMPEIIESGDIITIKREIFDCAEKVEKEVKNVYLGCTHFSLFSNYFEKAYIGKKILDGVKLFENEYKKELKKLIVPNDCPETQYVCSSKSVSKLIIMGKYAK